MEDESTLALASFTALYQGHLHVGISIRQHIRIFAIINVRGSCFEDVF
jgi:hypothetical protein